MNSLVITKLTIIDRKIWINLDFLFNNIELIFDLLQDISTEVTFFNIKCLTEDADTFFFFLCCFCSYKQPS